MAEIKEGPDLISQRIREVIRGLGGLKKTSERTGISVTQLSDYQTGKDKPGSFMLQKLARAGGVSVDWLLGLDSIDSRNPMNSQVREAPAPYGSTRLTTSGLDRADQKLVKEVEELLRDADDDVKRHLRNQVKLLRRVPRSAKQRASGED